MTKHITFLIVGFLFFGFSSYANSAYSILESLETDSTEIDSSQLNINIIKHSVQLICYDKTVAYIDTISGMVRGMNKSKMGKFLPNGKIKDGNGDQIGSIVGNEFMGVNGEFLGSINSSGEVLDMNEMKIGEITNTNKIMDANNSQIGEVAITINNKWLVAYYFFFFTI